MKKDATSTKGTIEYSYDATGVKLKKVTRETLASSSYTGELTTTTTYLGGLVYESKVYSPLHPDQVGHGNYSDKLLFITHEEGRIRREGATTATCTPQGARFVYDYFVRDHLGNTRMVLSEQSEAVCYLPATSEDSRQAEEKQIYDIVDARRKTLQEANVPTSYSQFEAKVYETNGAAEGKRTGLGAVLKVMAGDQVLLRCESYYNKPVSGTRDDNYPAVSELLAALVNSTGVAAKEAVTPQMVYDYATNASSLSPFLQSTPPENAANAYLNWILFDEQLKYVAGGADPVNPGGGYKLHVPASITAIKNGFLYVYMSNQSNYPVYFDNLNIRHTPGAIVEETHYYPFGLTMAGISSKAAGGLENKRKFNGIEHTTDLDLNQYDAFYRNMDPQIGRWWQIDPKPNMAESPYAMMGNNPILNMDPLGDTLRVQFRSGFLGLGGNREVIYNNGALSNKDGTAYTGKVKGFLKQTVNALNAGQTGSPEAGSMISELQGSKNNFTIVKGTENKFDVNPAQIVAGYANQLKTDPSLAPSLAVTPAAAMQGGAGGTIRWNPSGGANVFILGGGQDNNPTTNLMHELFHGRDANRGLLDNRIHLGIKRDEWQASYKENIVRQQMGSPLREFYRVQDAAGVITPLPPRLLDAANNPILPAWVPAGW